MYWHLSQHESELEKRRTAFLIKNQRFCDGVVKVLFDSSNESRHY